jgi:hypothetical protein
MRLLALAFLGLAACGGGGAGSDNCAGDYDGEWKGDVNDTLTLSADCQYDYQGQGGCSSAGTYDEPIGNQGSVHVVITSSTGGFCLPAGSYTCTYTASPTTMSFDCGVGSETYTR